MKVTYVLTCRTEQDGQVTQEIAAEIEMKASFQNCVFCHSLYFDQRFVECPACHHLLPHRADVPDLRDLLGDRNTPSLFEEPSADRDATPDPAILQTLREWPPPFDGLMRVVETNWRYSDWGFQREGQRYSLSTAGWSGNEEIIAALSDNLLFWSSHWESSRRGGHHTFDLEML